MTWLHTARLSLAWGVAAGAGFGLATVVVEGYLPLGLHVLAARAVLDAMPVYVGLACSGGLFAVGAQRLFVRLAPRLAVEAGPLVRALCVTLPTWAGVALHDRWILPEGLAPALTVLVTGAALQTVALLLVQRIAPAVLRPSPRLAVLALALALAGVVAATAVGRVWPALRGPAGRANLLLVVMDTVRADRLSSYGYPRPTSPEIDAFAGDAVRFSQFYSTSSWTIPSHASLFTGLFPVAHGANQTQLRLDRRHATLAEILQDAGFQTFAASGNPFVGEGTRLDQGFESFVRTWSREPRPEAEPHRALVAFREFLAGADRDRPFFAFVNLMEAHSPFWPPPDLRSRFVPRGVSLAYLRSLAVRPWTDHYTGRPFDASELSLLSDLYDGEVAWVSRIFGSLLDALREDGRYGDTWIVLTSDHGEHFGENGRVEHYFTLYNTAVRVPLFVRPPAGTGGRVEDARPAQLVDLFASLLAVSGARPPVPHQGVDLLDPEQRRKRIFSEYSYPQQVLELFSPEVLEKHGHRLEPHRRSLRALQQDGMRLIWSSDGRHELYDLTLDPGETRNLYDPDDARALELAGILEDYQRGSNAGLPQASGGDVLPPLDEESREALRALGYVR